MPGDVAPDNRNLRVSHEDRDQVAEQLRVAAGDGRLTADELDERLETALTARTYGELEVLLVDLPAAPGARPAPAADGQGPGGAARSPTARSSGTDPGWCRAA